MRMTSATATSLRLPENVKLDDWLRLGREISRRSSASAWWLGDWLLFGERRYAGRYRAAIDSSGLDYQTLRNYAWVARAFAPSRRRDTLSFQHHVELAALPEPQQELWLNRAERLRWSRNELRRQLSAARTAGDPPGRSSVVRLLVTPTRQLRWQEAADAAGRTLEEWLAGAADEAAGGAADEAPAMSRSRGPRRAAAGHRARAG
jgi:hypothetical protein